MIVCYRGNLSNPGWLDEDICEFFRSSRCLVLRRHVLASFTELRTVAKANLSGAAYNSAAKIGISGEAYYQVDVDLVVYFGSTELTAQMEWEDNVSHDLSPQLLSSL